MPGGTPGEAIKLDEVGISHVSWWVDDIRGLHEKLKAAGVKVLVHLTRPMPGDTARSLGGNI